MTKVPCRIQGGVYKLWFNAFLTVQFCIFVCKGVRVRENEYLKVKKRSS